MSWFVWKGRRMRCAPTDADDVRPVRPAPPTRQLTLALLVGALTLALGGCATEFSMHSLPPDTPAAVNASAVRAAEAMEAAENRADAGQDPTQPGRSPGSRNGNRATGEGALPNSPAQIEPGTTTSADRAGTLSNSAAAAANASAPDATNEGSAATADAGAGAVAGSPGADSEPLVPLTDEDVPSMYTYDPWERLNRVIYRFNARFDEAIFLPVANGYRRVPGPVRLGVHNFFSNLTEVDSVANHILQARWLGSVKSLGRFVINSTIGIGGLFDVATHMKLPSTPTGFSETLSTWGAHPGPYLVMPILGPSTLRDGVGYLGDYGLNYGVNIFDLYRGYQSYALGTLNAIDTRSNVGFRYYATGSPFEYEVIRFLYVRKRLIEDDALHGRGKPKPRDADAPAGR